MDVYVTYWDNASKQQFMDGLKTHLGHHKNSTIHAGATIVCANSDNKEVFAVCTVKNWSDTNSSCRPHHLLDTETYTGEYSKFSNYEICIENLRFLKNPVSFADVRTLVGGTDVEGPTNMWKGFHNFCPVFVGLKGARGPATQAIVSRYCIWAKSLL
jgi:hypothetical protein